MVKPYDPPYFPKEGDTVRPYCLKKSLSALVIIYSAQLCFCCFGFLKFIYLFVHLFILFIIIFYFSFSFFKFNLIN